MTENSIQPTWSNFFSDRYGKIEWICIKISVVMAIWPKLIYTLLTRSEQPYPSGICNIINCASLTADIIKYIVVAVLLILAILYVLEKKMLYTTMSIFLLALIIFSLEESNGQMGRTGIMSLIFFAQALAYFFKYKGINSHVEKNRMQFSIQIIAAVYILSGISKLTTSGLYWINDAPYIALQIMKSYQYNYVNTGVQDNHGIMIANWIGQHMFLVRFALGAALVLELCSFMLVLHKKWAFYYSFLLLFMHIGIYLTLNILFPTVSNPLIIFFINPLYIIFLCLRSIYRWIKPSPVLTQ